MGNELPEVQKPPQEPSANQARPHQGIGQAVLLPKPSDTSIIPGSEVVGISILNDLHHDYHRRAA